MTRIAVAKHLRLLEEAGLVVSRRRGREKLHYLNPVPIRLVHDRWVSKYTEPWAAGLAGLKHELEASDGEGLRDLHPHDARTPVGGDHRPGDPGEVPLRRRRSSRTGRRARPTGSVTRPRSGRWSRARTSSSNRRAGSCRRCTRCGARRRARRHVPGDLGDRAGRRLVPADGDPRSAPRRTRRPSSTADGR